MNGLSNFGVGKKIMSGFAALTIVIVATLGLAIFSITENQKVTTRAFDLRVPTVLNTSKMMNGINYSLAALRGYMILGKDGLKAQRSDAWRQLRENEAKLKDYSKNWTNPENVRRLATISRSLDAFELAQQEVESVAWTIDETPATKVLVEQAAPLAAVIIAEITSMINIEAGQPATTERKALLGMMADVRGSMAMALANIRAYLLTGDNMFRQEFNRYWATNSKRFEDLNRSANLLTSAQRNSFDKLKTARAEFAPLPPKMFDIRGSEKWNTANYLLGLKAAPEAAKIMQLLQEMEANQAGLAAIDISQAKSDSEILPSQLAILGLVGLIIAILISIVITRMVTIPVEQVAKGLKAIAAGDLRMRFTSESQDELGDMIRDMDAMSVSLKEIVTHIVEYSDTVAAASYQISNGNIDLSQRTEEQASSLEETASSIEEMTATVKQNAASAQKANEVATTARDQAEKGGAVVGQAVQAMSEINRSSAEIADIISTIDSIAFQTNLLALNAAVEAARAGDQGSGFAVVAQEVRTLAQRSADAAKEIKTLIETSVEKVKIGTELVDESGEALSNIVTSVKEVAELVNEIDFASREQSSGIDQINQAVAQMDDMTQQNAALVEESAAASSAMQEQAGSMGEMMKFFTLDTKRTFKAHTDAPAPVQAHAQPAAVHAKPAVAKAAPAAKPAVAATPEKASESEWEEF